MTSSYCRMATPHSGRAALILRFHGAVGTLPSMRTTLNAPAAAWQDYMEVDLAGSPVAAQYVLRMRGLLWLTRW